eukprot:TRINITY_DN1972_c0_g1_i3.p1 TRINITY_DN1972_c0_g1~~TRINITY_DN1972_c0_g1_i3.p1  ORF type:complete len:685 (+),score=227.02 TRINITY_DN1972_c0_g1_i3:219-2273(+)
MGAEEDNDGGDGRQDWMEGRVCTTLKVKKEKFKELAADEEGMFPIKDFLEQPSAQQLFIWDDGKKLKASTQPEDKYKKKACYFVKLEKIKVDPVNFAQQIVCGDFSACPLEHLLVVAQEVYLPMIGNPLNQEGWPDVISKDVIENYHRFLANLFVTIGLTRGKTLLPLPPSDVPQTDGLVAKEKDRVHALEGSVVTWTRQIKNVLKTDPENLLKAGEHPGPLAQIQFWEAKAANLNSIHEQLTGAKIKKIIKVLELAKSTYCPTFGRLCSEVALARLEANENVAYLNTMAMLFDQLAVSDDFVAMRDIFRPMMHNILLIWTNSVHFNTPARLVVLFRMISNDLIRQAAKFCDGVTIFEIEPQDAVDRVKQAIELCMKFQKDYMEYKNKANVQCKQNPWRVQMPALFGRLDTFLERCSDMQDLVETILQFNRLDKIEIGGTKGKALTDSVSQVFADFLEAVKKFEEVSYDVFDVEEKQFEEDYYHFRVQIKEMERRLGSVLVQGLDDCATVDAAFKLLGSFEGLLEREIIQNELERRYIGLLNQYSADLKQVQEMFLLKKTCPPIYNNMPPIAGSLNWSRGLGDRADQPMSKFRQCSKSILDSDEMKEVEKMHAGIMENLQEYERMKCEDWEKEIDVSVAAKLKQPLLRRDLESQTLHVNFDKALVRLLRAVSYTHLTLPTKRIV